MEGKDNKMHDLKLLDLKLENIDRPMGEIQNTYTLY
jgi:hypothetical protein